MVLGWPLVGDHGTPVLGHRGTASKLRENYPLAREVVCQI